MRPGHAIAGNVFRSLVTALRQCAADRFSAVLLAGGICALVVLTWPPLQMPGSGSSEPPSSLPGGSATTGRVARQHDVYGNQALLEIAGKAAKLGGWVVHLPERRIEWSDETWEIHGTTKQARP